MNRSPVAETTNKQMGQRSLVAYCLERDTLLFSVKTALVVGTLLALINHGQALLTGHFTSDRLISLLLTYFVPFAVSMYSQIRGKQQRDCPREELASTALQQKIDTSLDEQSSQVQYSSHPRLRTFMTPCVAYATELPLLRHYT